MGRISQFFDMSRRERWGLLAVAVVLLAAIVVGWQVRQHQRAVPAAQEQALCEFVAHADSLRAMTDSARHHRAKRKTPGVDGKKKTASKASAQKKDKPRSPHPDRSLAPLPSY